MNCILIGLSTLLVHILQRCQRLNQEPSTYRTTTLPPVPQCVNMTLLSTAQLSYDFGLHSLQLLLIIMAKAEHYKIASYKNLTCLPENTDWINPGVLNTLFGSAQKLFNSTVTHFRSFLRTLIAFFH